MYHPPMEGEDRGRGRVCRSFPRTFAAVGDVLDFVEEFFDAASLDREHLFAIQFGAEELFTNLVKYGGGTHPIDVEIEHGAGAVALSLTDRDVERFDPREAPDADVTAPIEARRPGGLGLHLIRRVLDEIDYTWEGRRGRTRIVKKLR